MDTFGKYMLGQIIFFCFHFGHSDFNSKYLVEVFTKIDISILQHSKLLTVSIPLWNQKNICLQTKCSEDSNLLRCVFHPLAININSDSINSSDWFYINKTRFFPPETNIVCSIYAVIYWKSKLCGFSKPLLKDDEDIHIITPLRFISNVKKITPADNKSLQVQLRKNLNCKRDGNHLQRSIFISSDWLISYYKQTYCFSSRSCALLIQIQHFHNKTNSREEQSRWNSTVLR